MFYFCKDIFVQDTDCFSQGDSWEAGLTDILTMWHFRWSCDGSQFQPISTGTILQWKRERETEHSAESSQCWRSDTLMFTEIESLNNILYQKRFLFVFTPSPIVFLSHFSLFLSPFLHYLINYLMCRDTALGSLFRKAPGNHNQACVML